MTTDEFARSLMKSGGVFTRADVYAFVEQTAKWQKQRMINKFVGWYKANHYYNAATIKKFKEDMKGE